jgi:hypothetical protein
VKKVEVAFPPLERVFGLRPGRRPWIGWLEQLAASADSAIAGLFVYHCCFNTGKDDFLY